MLLRHWPGRSCDRQACHTHCRRSCHTHCLLWPRTTACEEEPQMAAGLRGPRTAGVNEPRTAAGMWELRTMAGWLWLRAGHSPDTGGSPPSILVLWCLGGPRDDGGWPRARTARGWWRHQRTLPWQSCRTPTNTRSRGDLGEQGR